MLTYDLEQRGKLSRYEYLYRCIKEDILSGRLQAGEKLPSKRALAQHLEVAVVTVENAYAQLAAEGYLRPENKRGFFVSRVETSGNRNKPLPVLLPEQRQETNWCLDMKAGGSGTEGFPFSVWARLMRRVITERGTELLAPMPHNGVLELRQAISGYLYRFRGISVHPNQIVVGAGTEYLYNLLVQLLGRERIYGVENPGYYKAERIYTLSGARCVSVPVDRQGAIPQALPEQADVLHLSPNHQFPTGTVMPIARRQQLLRWAEEGEDRWIIEDDYDSEFRFTGLPIPTMKESDLSGRVIYMNTFSRTLAPSLRISYMVLPDGLMEQYRQRLGFYSCTVPAMEQYTLALFLEEGGFEAHINRMRIFYRSQRDRAIAAVRDSDLKDLCEIEGEQAGLHFLLRLHTQLDDRALFFWAREQGIRLSFLRDYGQGQGDAWAHTLIIHYPGMDPERLKWALNVLALGMENG